MPHKQAYKKIYLLHLLIFLFCHVIHADENNKYGGESNKKSEEVSKNEGMSVHEIRIETKISAGFPNIFEEIEKIRNSIPIDNNLNFPYEQIFFYRKKNHGILDGSLVVANEKLNHDVIKDLLHKLGDQTISSGNETGTDMYNKGVAMLNSFYSNKKEAYSLLVNASRLGNNRAKAEVAWGLMYGTDLPQNITLAKELFERLAEEGVPEGHTGMGFLHSLGLTVKSSQARALLHYTIGALGGSNWSRMILGFRNWFGITVASNCEKALEFYRPVATHVASKVESNGGPFLYRIRLLDEAENSRYQTGLIDSDLRDYYEMLADKGEVSAQVGLGQLYYRGARGLPKDYKKALMYFQRAAMNGNSVAIAFMGKIYLEGGDNVDVDLMKAFASFTKAADQGNAVGQFGLGLMYLEGKYVEKNINKALTYLSQSADQGWVESLLVLGTMYLQGSDLKRDYRMARKYFIMAAQVGHVLGYFNLAQMHSSGLGTMRSCMTAVELFKNVAERGKWGKHFMEAYVHYKNQRYSEAFVIYALLAEMGYEVAQNNAAFLLDHGLFNVLNEDEEKRYVRARIYWTRSAMQGNPLAYIKLGDYYYYGLGTKVDYETAVAYYKIASEKYNNPQAMFNLGYMQEQGLGLKKDLHLAKRSYDMAAEASSDAEFPVLLALVKLYVLATVSEIKEMGWRRFLALRMMDAYLGEYWDIYLSGFLLIAGAYIIHFRVNRRDLLRDLLNFL